jgi:hypothetical protein
VRSTHSRASSSSGTPIRPTGSTTAGSTDRSVGADSAAPIPGELPCWASASPFAAVASPACTSASESTMATIVDARQQAPRGRVEFFTETRPTVVRGDAKVTARRFQCCLDEAGRWGRPCRVSIEYERVTTSREQRAGENGERTARSPACFRFPRHPIRDRRSPGVSTAVSSRCSAAAECGRWVSDRRFRGSHDGALRATPLHRLRASCRAELAAPRPAPAAPA